MEASPQILKLQAHDYQIIGYADTFQRKYILLAANQTKTIQDKHTQNNQY